MQHNNLLKLYSSAAQQSVPRLCCRGLLHAFNTICRKLPFQYHQIGVIE